MRPTGDEVSTKRTFYNIDKSNNGQVCQCNRLDLSIKSISCRQRSGRRKCIGLDFLALRIPITRYGVDIMATKTSNGKIKKTSRGMRKHVRRMKQESRKTGVPVNELKKRVRSTQVPKTKKEA